MSQVSQLVIDEWHNRVVAEYGSATITQELVLWLMVLGAPPDLLDEGLAIVADELAHSRLAHAVYEAAFATGRGGAVPACQIDRAQLGLPRRYPQLELDVLAATVQMFCLGETVAVPLFAKLRANCQQPLARVALDRIVADEVRHRDFGWDLLDYLLQTPLADVAPGFLRSQLPTMFATLQQNYGSAAPPADDADAPRAASVDALADADAAWGLASSADYRDILQRTVERDYLPRFAARMANLDVMQLWRASLALVP